MEKVEEGMCCDEQKPLKWLLFISGRKEECLFRVVCFWLCKERNKLAWFMFFCWAFMCMEVAWELSLVIEYAHTLCTNIMYFTYRERGGEAYMILLRLVHDN